MPEDDTTEPERRKLLAQALPYMLNVYWEARTTFSPGGLAAVALNQYERVEQNHKLQRVDLELLAHDLGQLDMKIEGAGRISLTLSKDQLLGFIRNYLISYFLSQGSSSSELVRTKGKDYDATLTLPSKTIFVKLRKSSLDEAAINLELERAKALNPSEVWIFPYFGIEGKDIRFDPVFVSEDRILYGHLRVVPVSEVMTAATGGRFFAFAVNTINGVSVPKPDEDSLRLLLVKNVTSSPPQKSDRNHDSPNSTA
jgi:hypothetical protein